MKNRGLLLSNLYNLIKPKSLIVGRRLLSEMHSSSLSLTQSKPFLHNLT